ncbi:MAG: hypothetical protein QOH63_1953 [Acidobacteriota bacterium]|jgi:hypothetical protein|nr:hypothetical protein [Acidobacteriota bacterium]
MKNKILQITRDSIPYVKSLRALAGSVTGCILMQQLDYWFAKHPEGFFKFLEPCPNSPHYKEGDSWTEEIGFSTAEFRTAFDSIGVRYTSKKQYDEALASNVLFEVNELGEVKQKFYCSYHDKIKGITLYFRNHELVDAELDKLQLPEIKKSNIRKSTTSIYVNEESQSTEMHNLNPEYKDSETTSETTSEREQRACAAIAVFSEIYGHPPHIPGQTEIEATDVDDLVLFRSVVKQCHANLTPAKNVGTICRMYAEQRSRAARGSPSVNSPPAKLTHIDACALCDSSGQREVWKDGKRFLAKCNHEGAEDERRQRSNVGTTAA